MSHTTDPVDNASSAPDEWDSDAPSDSESDSEPNCSDITTATPFLRVDDGEFVLKNIALCGFCF